MNEITRIHIAKTAYDIEIAAKKQLEKYIKSLETYTQDQEVLVDIEIRMTELLAERGVKAGGVIGSDDVAAIRSQLGEPHEFADNDSEGDIAIGPDSERTGRRLYRSTDTAVLGGVLGGIAAYYNINPLWTRLAFVVLMFISFGTAAFVYILFWILIAPARTATEKLQLAGKDVTLESIKKLNADEERVPTNTVAPILQQIFSLGLGALSALGALVTLAVTIWMVVSALTLNEAFTNATNSFTGLGEGNMWLVWLLFWVVVFGMVLLTALFSLVAYAFFAKKLNKMMIISGVVIIVLGIASAATVIGVGSTQSMRIANESRSLVRETKVNLPKEFANVKSATISMRELSTGKSEHYFSAYPAIRYVVDEGPARYELTALPTAKAVVSVEGANANISLEIPQSYRNTFVQPLLTVYGPALENLKTDTEKNNAQISYDGVGQDSLVVPSVNGGRVTVSGTFEKMTVTGSGSVDLGQATIKTLIVSSEQNLNVTAGTVRELTITQPDVCPAGTYGNNTSIDVAGVTSGKMVYNGKEMTAASQQTACAVVTIGSEDEEYNY